MNKIYLIGTGGVERIPSVAERFSCEETDIVLVEKIEDIDIETIKVRFQEEMPDEKSFKITEVPILESEFSKKKKPKNKNWQNRMKQLQRR